METGALELDADGNPIRVTITAPDGTVTLTAKTGIGTATLLGNNSYNGETTVAQGTLIAASSTNTFAGTGPLGTTAAGTTVVDGATLGLAGNINLAQEQLTLDGTGAAGRGAEIGLQDVVAQQVVG